MDELERQVAVGNCVVYDEHNEIDELRRPKRVVMGMMAVR